MAKVYEYRTTVTIGDTNLLQNMYFHNFFKLQGTARELWVKDCVKDGISDLQKGMVLITREANCKFIKDFFLYNPVVVQLNFTEMQKTNVKIRFRFLHGATGKLHVTGYQRIISAYINHHIIEFPENWENAGREYLDSE